MKKFSIRISDETYQFISGTAQKKGTTMSEVCTGIIENYRSEAKSFEESVLKEIHSTNAVLEKVIQKISELDNVSRSNLLIQRLISRESSRAGFLARVRFEEFAEGDKRRESLQKMDQYVNAVDENIVKTLQKMDVV